MATIEQAEQAYVDAQQQQQPEQEPEQQEAQTPESEQTQEPEQQEDEFAGMSAEQLRDMLKKRDSKWKRRLDREVAKRHDEERARLVAEQIARARQDERGTQQRTQQNTQQAAQNGIPKPEGWDDWTAAQQVAYIAEVRAREAARQEWETREQERERHVQQQQMAREHQQVQSRVQDLAEKGSATYEDFEDKVFAPGLTVSPVMARAMAESDSGYHVMYFLGSNPKEAERIARLSPMAQVREIGKLEVRFEKGVTQSKAPKPGTPAGTRGAPSSGVHDELPIGEWMKREAARARTGS